MYGRARRTVGLTLIEMTLVVATIALLMGLALPAVRAMMNSFQSEGGTKSIIHAALNSARTMAVTHQRYIGVRFQKAYRYDSLTPFGKGLLDAPQYMVFIVREERENIGDLADGFRAMEGHEPIKLPQTIGVTDLTVVLSHDKANCDEVHLRDASRGGNARINDAGELADITTFSIIFSPSGKLVTHWVRVRNNDGIPDTKAEVGNHSLDDVFNKKGDVDVRSAALVALGMGTETGMFYQDDYYGELDTPSYPDAPAKADLGLGPEYSRTSFVIYDCSRLQQAFNRGTAWSEYLSDADKNATVFVSPYTGDLISPQ